MRHALLRRARSLGAAVFCLSGSACGASPGADDGPIVVDAADLNVLGTSDAIAVVDDLAVLADGTVWVQNSGEPYFVGFGPEGERVAAHGSRGGGPDEFGRPVGFVVGGLDGEAWVFDRDRHALVRISTPETRADVPLPTEAVPPGSVMTGLGMMGRMIRLARLGDEVVLPRRAGTGEFLATEFWTTMWNAELVALDPETGSVRTVLSLPDAMDDVAAHFQSLSTAFPPFPLWYRLWAVCGDEVRLYDFVRDELRGFTAAGTELEPIPVPPLFIEVTPRQFARAAFDLAVVERAGAVTAETPEISPADSAMIVDGLAGRLEGTPQQLAALLPKFVDFRCADDGTMWLRPLDLERGGMRGGPAWLRIAGDELREVRFPERFDPYRFTGGRVWGVLRDELDVASVVWVRAPGGG
jgi:hypothetical protein